MTLVLEYLKAYDVQYKESVNIADISSIKIGGTACVVAYPNDEDKFISLIKFLKNNKIVYKIVGRMTNILHCGEIFEGVIVSTEKLCHIETDGALISAACGVPIPRMVYALSKLGIGGFERLFGIPGSIGGMIYNNGGAYGQNISDVLLYARVFSTRDFKIRILDCADMRFAYRYSRLMDDEYVLLSACLVGVRRDGDAVRDDIRRFMALRRLAQPHGQPSLGSIFRRTDGIAVSALIDALGLKGTAIGGAAVSEKHAGFIVNRGGATARDVIELIALIKRKIWSAYGIELHEEIEYLN